MDKNFYNESSANQLGWDPSWFGEKYFDDKLVRAVKKFQKQYGLSADGLCGPTTFRRLFTERSANIDEYEPTDVRYSNYIVYNGSFHPIKWDKVVLWSEQGGLAARPGSHYDYTGRPKRQIRLFVNHWDVCLNSRDCQSILDSRGISVHFLIDNDGTIYQTLDMQHGGFHAGKDKVNRASVGVEISNAYYPQYQDWYVRNGYGERSMVEGATVHGATLDPFMDFYPVQIEALKALWVSIHDSTGVEYEAPLDSSGNTSTKYEQSVAYGNFSGYISHYHVSKQKIDCANLDLKTMLEEVTSDE
jgi:hypothetical protein|tara:strand:- start:1197 stop:2102 length:906 start_codon:yes stop_codon:yes gene_type:complete